jgi:hypothetical protein
MADLKLSFLNNKLDKEQLMNAQKVAKAAREAGVDPALAVSIAFAEGSLRSEAKDSDKGAIGMMQVLIPTGQAYGYSEADLRDPEKNLQAGLKNIKEALAYTENNPKLAALYYHSGPTAIADLAANNPIGPKAKQYLLDLKSFGTFEAFNPDFKAPAEAEATPEAPETPEAPVASLADAKELTTAEDFIRENSAADLRRQEYGAMGGLGGAAVAASPYVGRTAATTVGKLAKAFNEAKAPTAPTAPMGGLPTGGAPTPPQTAPGTPTGSPMGGLSRPMGPADGGRMPQGQTGVIPYNTSKALGLTDIEAGQALTNTKQEGGAWDLAEKRRESMTRLQNMGAGNFVENPRFGGIMTQAPGVGGGPRESFAMQTPEAGKPAQLAPIPKAPIIPTTPPPPSGLDQVKNLFTGMMSQGMRLMPVIGPPLAGLSIGRDLADIQTQYERAPIERDYTDIGLSTAGALATGASLYPPAFPVAAPLSIGIPTFRNIRRNVLAQESDPELQRKLKLPPTEEEIEIASRPYIGYPRQTGQKPFQPRVPPLGTVLPTEIIGN